jgi:hypothetical protein
MPLPFEALTHTETEKETETETCMCVCVLKNIMTGAKRLILDDRSRGRSGGALGDARPEGTRARDLTVFNSLVIIDSVVILSLRA